MAEDDLPRFPISGVYIGILIRVSGMGMNPPMRHL